MRRQAELDWLRGLMLVLMTLTHLPTWFSAQMGQPFGYVSAAEGFVFVSAFLVGAVYTRIALDKGYPAMRRQMWRRAVKIYAAHVAVLVFLLWVVLPFAIARGAHPVTDLASFYIAHPRQASAAALLLLYQPPLLDILPMYVLFMLATPLVLATSARRGWRPLFAVSIALWALAQFDFGHVLYDMLVSGSALPLPPYRQTGAFAVLGWQLLWLCGLCAGTRSLAGPPRLPRGWVVAAATLAVGFFSWRHWSGQVPAAPLLIVEALDKWHLGALRLMNFAGLAVLAVAARQTLADWARHSALTTLGRASLPVFCTHVCICLVALAMVADPSPLQLHWRDSALLSAVLVVLYLVAVVAAEGKRLAPRIAASVSSRLAARKG
ncbi:MAG: OpgC domain-containing protein [Casimicrobiaceae bacterium]